MVPHDVTMAGTFYEQLKRWIQMDEKSLQAEQRLVITFSNQGDPVQVTGIEFHNPNMITLYGLDRAGKPVIVLAHMASVALLLRHAEAPSQQEPRRIGFRGDDWPSE